MPDFKGLENFRLVLFFVVPGIVMVYTRSRFITGRMPSLMDNILSFVVLSLIYYAIISPFMYSVIAIKDPYVIYVIIWNSTLLIGPALLGALLGIAAQKDIFSNVSSRFNLTIIHVIPTAWDWKFSKVPRGGQFIMVTLANDEKVAGFFGENSFASSDSGERDLYIEEEYVVTKADIWEPRSDKVGILVAAKEIKYIEFWDPKAGESANG